MRAWQATVQDEAGNVIFNPVITVYQEDGETLADIFNEDGTSKENPFTGTTEGFAQFWAERGTYRVVGANGGVSETWQVDLADKAALELAEDVEQTQARRDFGKWHLVDYLHPDDMAAALNGNIAGQDESRVTAAIRQMHDDAMDWWRAGNFRTVRAVFPNAQLAVNDEVFSDEFAGFLWDSIPGNNKWIMSADGTTLVVRNWTSQSRVRNTGLYEAQSIDYPVPSVVFRWERRPQNGVVPTIEGALRIRPHSPSITSDPIGVKLHNGADIKLGKISVTGLRNHQFCLEGMFNGSIDDLNLFFGGYQPTEYGGEFGHMPHGARFSNIGPVITATEPVFNSTHVGRMFAIAYAGLPMRDTRLAHWGEIVSVDSPTQITLDNTPPIDVTNRVASFEAMRASVSSGSNIFTMSASLSENMTGRLVTLCGARGTDQVAGFGTLTTTVVSHSGNTLEVADPSALAVDNGLLVFSPQLLIDRVSGSPGPGITDNVMLKSPRVESTGWSTICSVQSVFGAYTTATVSDAKFHGSGIGDNNFGGSAASVVLGRTLMDFYGILSQAGNSPRWGYVTAVGGDMTASFRGNFSGYPMTSHTALVYLNPSRAPESSLVSIRVGMTTGGTEFPQSSQAGVRYGPNGREGMVTTTGSDPRGNHGAAPVFLSRFGRAVIDEIDGDAVQSVPYDGVSGRLLRVGAFGQAGAEEAQSAANPNNLFHAGTWRVFNSPEMPTNGAFIVEVLPRTGEQILQRATLLSVDRPISYQRSFYAGSWRAWRKYNLVYSGPTAARPVSPFQGEGYFDTTLSQPIWWNGTAWVDATGTTV